MTLLMTLSEPLCEHPLLKCELSHRCEMAVLPSTRKVTIRSLSQKWLSNMLADFRELFSDGILEMFNEFDGLFERLEMVSRRKLVQLQNNALQPVQLSGQLLVENGNQHLGVCANDLSHFLNQLALFLTFGCRENSRSDFCILLVESRDIHKATKRRCRLFEASSG